MKIITNLQGDSIEGEVSGPDRYPPGVMNQFADGKFRQIKLGPGGLLFQLFNERKIFIPVAALWSLAESHEEEFRAPVEPPPPDQSATTSVPSVPLDSAAETVVESKTDLSGP
jgi:hypothetical protein